MRDGPPLLRDGPSGHSAWDQHSGINGIGRMRPKAGDGPKVGLESTKSTKSRKSTNQ